MKPRIVLADEPVRGALTRPWVRIAAVVGIAVVAMFAGVRLADIAPAVVGTDSRALTELQEEKERLMQELAIARRAAQVAEQAGEHLRNQILGLETELADSRVDVAFYQRLLESGGERKGLAVHDLRVRATSSPLVYRFRLTLSQNLERAQVVEGALSIGADGVLDNRMVELDAEALGLRVAGPSDRFRFKYFQEFDGSLELPAGFMPERLIVRLDAERASAPVVRRFEWSTLTAVDTTVATTEGN